MTTTNQAFIRAHSNLVPVTMPPVAMPSEESAAPQPTPPPLSPSTLDTVVEIVTNRGVYDSPRIVLSTADVVSKPLPPIASDGDSADSPQRRVDVPIEGKLPLSSFTNQSESAAQVPDVTELVPHTTIGQLAWPTVCDDLWKRCNRQIEFLAGQVIAKANDGRSLVAVAGLQPALGCTTTLLCLARGLIARRRSVIVIDANFAAPGLAPLLGFEPTAGGQDIRTCGTSIAESIVRATEDRLDLLPLQADQPNSARTAESIFVSAAAGVLRFAYDVVLLDVGPILDPAAQESALNLLRQMRVDTALVVTDQTSFGSADVATAAELLSQSGCDLMGVVENRVASR